MKKMPFYIRMQVAYACLSLVGGVIFLYFTLFRPTHWIYNMFMWPGLAFVYTMMFTLYLKRIIHYYKSL